MGGGYSVGVPEPGGNGTESPPPTVITVIGMMRAGTSLTARIVNLLGVYLGREDELLGGDLRQIPDEARPKASTANPEGFWEHYRLMRLNEGLLRAFSGNWRQPPPLPAGWEASERLAGEREEARELLAGSFSGRRLWGWKDPRGSLTLPFWRGLLPQLRCVVCLRNPLDVAASLQRREGMSLDQSLDLWRTYMEAALASTASVPRVVVSYEDYFADSSLPVGRLTGLVGLPALAERSEATARIDATIKDSLRHHRSSSEALLEDPRVPAAVAAVYRTARALAEEEPLAASATP